MDRIPRGSANTIQARFSVDEAPLDSSIPVTIEVVRDNGDVVVPAGTATNTGAVGDGLYEFTLLPSHTGLVDILTARWTATLGGEAMTLETRVEVVGGFYFTLADGRASDDALADTVKYPTARLAEARDEVEDECEDITNVAWVRRYAKVTLSGDGSNNLVLPHYMVRSVRSIVDGDTTAWTAPQLAALRVSDSGVLSAARTGAIPFAFGDRNLTVIYEHGYDQPPADLRRASIIRFRSFVFATKSGIPDRATSFVAAEGGNFTLSTPGRAGTPTGIPEVDAAYNRHDHFLT